MNIPRTLFDGRRNGSALVLVMIFLVLAAMILGAALSWTTNSSRLTERNNQYFRTVSAAEAATEKVMGRMINDYRDDGESLVFAKLDEYRALVPTATENGGWADYEFLDPQGSPNRTYIQFIPPSEFRVVSSQYRGLRGYASAFRLISNARDVNSPMNIVAAVRQDIELATIPIFQFAIFYNIDLEINPGPVMTVTGPVHCNSTIYLEPQNTLTFQSDVTAAGAIIHHKKPGDPLNRTEGTIVFNAEHDAGVSTLNLPIGTNNHPLAVREVIKIPPAGESHTSAMGKQRYYNKADMVIVVNDAGITATSGRSNSFNITIPPAQVSNFVNTGVTFFSKRESKTIKAVEIDIGKLKQWNETSVLRAVLPLQDVRIVYVADLRSQSSSTEAGVRLVNGQTLLPKGLTVASPNPIYIQGNYNAPAQHLGTLDTSATLPASVVGDAITILSPAWDDTKSAVGLGARKASPTTVNAALLAGIVQTVPGSYSGGVENFPRFLEDWDQVTFTYSGSMVVMFDSETAIGPWRGTGATIGIYNPPRRNWAFDQNFRDINKLPPGTPCIRALIRGTWATIAPRTTS